MSKRKQPVNNRSFYYIVATALVVGIGLVIIASFTGEKLPPRQPSDLADGSLLSANVAEIDLTTGTSLGDESAPITIVEFGDYQCPGCANFATTVFPELREKYIDTGQVRYVSKDFPLEQHPQARPVAEYVQCAVDQGKYWELRHSVFANQSEWSNQKDFLTRIDGYAAQLGLDTAALNDCVQAGSTKAAVQVTRQEGNALRIPGTPTLYINGRQVNGGGVPLGVLELLFDEVQADAN